jgi:outer membrane protein assembly factor BamA
VTAALLALTLLVTQATERVVDVRVQGNTLTADAEIIRMAAVPPGTAVTPTLIDDIAARLKAAGNFRRVEVLKRYASISDLSQVLLVIVVDEGRVSVRPARDGEPARAVRRRAPPLMVLPLLGSDEGFGFTYGALVTLPNVVGPRTSLSVPLTWGGERRAAAAFEKRADSPRLTRVIVGASVLQRRSDALEKTDRREQVWVQGQREIARPLRVGSWAAFDAVTFGDDRSNVLRLGADAAVDTRVDPMLSRNAIYLRAAIERLGVQDEPAPIRTLTDLNVYIGGPGPTTIAVRAYRNGANRSVPPYLRVLLGRDSTLRGFPAGSAAGDSTAAGSIELRVPVTSPMRIAKFGVRAFIDAATVYDAGEHLADQHFERGAGGGVWMTATVIRLALDVAHGSGGSTRVQLTSGLLF